MGIGFPPSALPPDSIGSQRPQRYQLGSHGTRPTRISPVTTAPAARWQPGQIVPYENNRRRMQVENILLGGMGVVYVVTDLRGGDPFVVKAIRGHLNHMPSVRQRFQREADAWMKLGKHPHIVQARGFEYLEDEPHIFLEYVPGKSLRQLINEQRSHLAVPLALRIAIEVCRGMRHALSMGMRAHRDLKPDNILLSSQGTAKVTDFGLVKMLDAAEGEVVEALLSSQEGGKGNLTRLDVGFGTKEYMPPEQWLNAAGADARSDVYAFGVMLYEMLTGTRPFYGKSPDVLRSRHFTYEPPPPSERRKNLPPVLDTIVVRCLAKGASERYADFDTLENDLSKVLQRGYGQAVPQLTPAQMTVEEVNERGAAFFNLGKLDQALACFHEAIKRAPANATAWANRGVILAELGYHSDALASFDRALWHEPDNAVMLANKAMTLHDLGKTEEATECYMRAATLDPYMERAWHYQAENLNDLGRHQEALYAAVNALRLDRQNTHMLFEQARAFIGLGRPDRAQNALDEMSILPTAPELEYGRLLLYARIAEAQYDYDKALKLVSAVPPEAAEYPEAALLGIEYALTQDDLEEVAVLLPSVEFSPEQGGLLLVHFAAALSRFEVAADPGFYLRLLLLAIQAAVKARDFNAALGWYNAWRMQSGAPQKRGDAATLAALVARREPLDLQGRAAQGRLLLRLDEPALAARCLQLGVNMAPRSIELLRLLGVAFNRAGDSHNAMNAFERLSRLESDNLTIWCLLAEAAFHVGNMTVMQEAVKQAQRLDSGSAVAQLLYGLFEFASGNYAQTIRRFTRISAQHDRMLGAAALWNKGLCARLTGRMPLADRSVQQARALVANYWQLSAHESKPVLPYPVVPHDFE